MILEPPKGSLRHIETVVFRGLHHPMWLEMQPGAVLANERGMNVGTVNLGVAIRAGQTLRRSLSHAVECTLGHRTMALVAQHIHVRHIQHPRILRTMRAVTAKAPNPLHRGMLKHKGSAHVGVALGTDPVLIHSRPQIVWVECAVYVVAVGALHYAFGYRMMERHGELCLHIGVTGLAELRLRRNQEVLRRARVMHTVTADAAHTGLGVR